MTGAQIKKVLEDAVNFKIDPSGSWGAYPRASGLRYDVNEGQLFNKRITNLEVNPKLSGKWEPIDMDASYIVVTNNFIATPRDGYYEFGNIDDDKKIDSYVEYAQSFIEYAKSVETLLPVRKKNRSTQNWSDSMIVSICGNWGCLTTYEYTDNVKAKDETGFGNQQWIITDSGMIKSVQREMCLVKNKKFLQLGDCEGADTFMHNSFDGTLFLSSDSSKVVNAVGPSVPGDRVKFAVKGDKFDLGQIWHITNVN